MSRTGRLAASIAAAWRSFARRRTALFFTFLFPLVLVLIFGVLVETGAGGGGLFAEPPGWYVPGYLAVVVLFTPLTRIGSEVARHRDGNRFEKLATTPLTRPEWLLAQTCVAVLVIGFAAVLVLGLLAGATDAHIALGPPTMLLGPFVVLGVALFSGGGALIGSLADSQDGVVAASNAIAIPLLFLSETFVPVSMLPGWLPTELSPLTYFSRGVRAVTYYRGDAVLATSNAPTLWMNLLILTVLAAVVMGAGAYALPVTD